VTDQRANQNDDSGSEDGQNARETPETGSGLSRRDFTTRFGAGSAAAVGLAFASPHISTIRFAAKAAVGSPPPTTTTTTIPGQPGTVRVSSSAPCEGDVLTVAADGFAPKTAVALEIDSDEHTLGVATAGSEGKLNVSVRLPSGLTGSHDFVVDGVRPGGRTLTLKQRIRIKTKAECEGTTTTTSPPETTTSAPETTTSGPETTTSGPGTTGPGPATTGPAPGTRTAATGTTTTTRRGATPTTSTSPTSSGPSTTIAAAQAHLPGTGGNTPSTPSTPHGTSNGSGFLAFTGTDSVDLALLGAAAAVGGRALFGLVSHHNESDEEEE
jgi:hypothetical protein